MKKIKFYPSLVIVIILQKNKKVLRISRTFLSFQLLFFVAGFFRDLAGGGFFLLGFFAFSDAGSGYLLGGFGAELINHAGGIHQLLLAGVKRMAIGANFNIQLTQSGAGGKSIAASAFDLGLSKIFGVDRFFHKRRRAREAEKLAFPLSSRGVYIKYKDNKILRIF